MTDEDRSRDKIARKKTPRKGVVRKDTADQSAAGQNTSPHDISGNDTQGNNPSRDSTNPSPQMTLRVAESTADLAFIGPLTVAFHTESHFGDIPFSEEKRDRLLARALDRPDRFALLIAAYDDRPVGFLYCSISDYVVGRDDLITTILSFYIGGEFRNSIIGARAAVRLLKGAVRWSEARAAREVLVHATAGIDVTRADRFFRKAGFGILGASYFLPLRSGSGNADGTNDVGGA